MWRELSFLPILPFVLTSTWAQPVPTDASHPVIVLWPGGAPGSEGKTGEEKSRFEGQDQVVSNVHRPSLTVYLPPAGKATGAAVIVAPGGSYRELWVTHEGYRVAEWLSQRGIAGFVLKYRLPREQGSTYTLEGDSLADIQRAIRTVRARAAEWRVNPERVGVMGFSAGASLAGLAATHFGDPVRKAVDGIDRQSARPAFQALIYFPGSGAGPYSKETPEAFLACGGDDRIAEGTPDLYKALKSAGVPAELHIYAGVGHGFGIRASNPPAVAGWIERFREWLNARGYLK